jgi:hypothetical protein
VRASWEIDEETGAANGTRGRRRDILAKSAIKHIFCMGSDTKHPGMRGDAEVIVGYALTEKKCKSLFSPELIAHARCAWGLAERGKRAQASEPTCQQSAFPARTAWNLPRGTHDKTSWGRGPGLPGLVPASTPALPRAHASLPPSPPPPDITQVTRRALSAHRSRAPHRESGARGKAPAATVPLSDLSSKFFFFSLHPLAR